MTEPKKAPGQATEGKALPHVRLKRAGSQIAGSVLRNPRYSGEPSWTPTMTLLATLALAIAALATLVDAGAILAMRGNESTLRRVLAAITDLGESQWYLMPAALTVIALGLADWAAVSRRATARLSFLFGQAAFAFGAVAVSGILVNIVKLFFGRSRPRLMDDGGPFQFEPFSMNYLFQSFPSGHSTTSGAVAMVLILWFPRLWPLLAALGFVLATSRVAAQAHYPSDVVAGFSLGALYTLHLARFLAVRGRVFRIERGKLLPRPRHLRAWRGTVRGSRG